MTEPFFVKEPSSTYRFSPAAEAAIRKWWPETLTKAEFPEAMAHLQSDFIRIHAPNMNDEDRARARETLARLGC